MIVYEAVIMFIKLKSLVILWKFIELSFMHYELHQNNYKITSKRIIFGIGDDNYYV